MSLTPTISNNRYSKKVGKRGRRSDKKFRIRLYMTAKLRSELEEKALNKGSYFTKFASEMVEKVCQYVHRDSIPSEEIETRETFAFIKIGLDDYTKIRQYANKHKCTYETAVYSFFKYSQASRTKVKADERKALIEEEDDFWKKSEVVIKDWRQSI